MAVKAVSSGVREKADELPGDVDTGGFWCLDRHEAVRPASAAAAD